VNFSLSFSGKRKGKSFIIQGVQIGTPYFSPGFLPKAKRLGNTAFKGWAIPHLAHLYYFCIYFPFGVIALFFTKKRVIT